jgi:hypothetical protein
MTDPRARPDDRPNVGSQPLEAEIQELQGEELPVDQDAVLEPDEIEGAREPTLTEQDTGAASDPDRELLEEADETSFLGDIDATVTGRDELSLDELTEGELREGETDDPIEATEEGETWIPPTDPPVVPVDGDPDGIEVPGSADLDEAEGSLNAAIREALRSDSSTSALADRLEIAVVGSTAIIRGQVDGIEDGDAIVDVAGQVDGIEDVRDETEVPGL